MLQGTSSITDETDDDPESLSAKVRVACTISQLICSNTAKRATSAVGLYHRKERETPFPLYLGLKLHVNDRQRSTVSTLHGLGISVSYDRVMEVRRNLALAVSKRFQDNGLVVPTNMKHGLFTTGAVDNIDQSGRCEFYGKAISLTNHPTHSNMGQDPPPLNMHDLEETTVQLPEQFVNVPFVDEYAGEVRLSPTALEEGMSSLAQNSEEQSSVQAWLSHVQRVIKELNGKLQDVPVTYAGFLAHSQRKEDIRPRATVGVFPLLYDKAAMMAMQKHAMLVVAKATDFVNPHQVPVIVGDCPLYALQKKCQWVFPEEVGEQNMVSFMGLLHVEMTAQECGGKLLAGSGWDRMFCLSKIYETGVAASLLGGKHVKHTRHAYHLTLAWLHLLEIEAYEEYCNAGFGPFEPMVVWERRLFINAPTAFFWITVREYLSLMCRIVKGQRLGDWPLTLSALHDMCPWFFAFGHTNYARWLPVFLRDMAKLPETHPSVHEAFIANIFTFANRPPSDLKKGASKPSSAKRDTALVVKMFMSLPARREEDIADFFRHENSREPPALSEGGKLRSGTKSEILDCLPGMPLPGRNVAAKQASVLIFDMAVVIHMIRPQRATVFGDYTQLQLLPYLLSHVTNSTTRLDAVWDTYPEGSLKSQTRGKRTGETHGHRTRVSASIPLPKGSLWQKFLLNNKNKDEFFQFAADELHRLTSDMDILLLTTKAQMVLCNKPFDLTSVSLCQQEEADTRIMLHLQHAAQQGHQKAFIRTVDSDVVILAVSLFHDLGLSEVWVGLGTGKWYKDIQVHHIAQLLGPQKCQALAFFHVYTGCDCASAFHHIGKKTAWKVWGTLPVITDTFVRITHDPTGLTMDSLHMRLLERMTVAMYSKTCAFFSVNEARQFLYTVGLKNLESIPPTQHALYQHTRRAVLSAAIWRQSLSKAPEIPNPSEWGWEWNPRTKEWVPYWTDLPDVSKACLLLVCCGCEVACRGNCKCSRSGLRCSQLCKCQGGCTNNEDA
ncbi:hypothetical protein ACOMHN_061212 [Nucella lapillus]